MRGSRRAKCAVPRNELESDGRKGGGPSPEGEGVGKEKIRTNAVRSGGQGGPRNPDRVGRRRARACAGAPGPGAQGAIHVRLVKSAFVARVAMDRLKAEQGQKAQGQQEGAMSHGYRIPSMGAPVKIFRRARFWRAESPAAAGAGRSEAPRSAFCRWRPPPTAPTPPVRRWCSSWEDPRRPG